MDVKAAIARKDRALNLLQTKTAWLLYAIDHEDFEQIEDCIRERQNLIKELQICDETLKGHTTPRDATWSLQLSNLVSKQDELKQRYERIAAKLFQEFRADERERQALIRSLGEMSKGQNMNIQG